MADGTGIEWTEATWNPIRGCSRVSEGCRECYAERDAGRWSAPGQPYHGLVVIKEDGPAWTGRVQVVENQMLQPIKWQRPRRIFVNSMSDLFHENLSGNDVARIFAVMALSPWHTFQVLTKRARGMWVLLRDSWFRGMVQDEIEKMILTGRGFGWRGKDGAHPIQNGKLVWPLPNVWIGVSVENQKNADARIPLLMEVPAKVRWLSVEPMIGEVDLSRFVAAPFEWGKGVDWIVCGGESGPPENGAHGARPMALAWAAKLAEQASAASVPFFMKQLGSYQSKLYDMSDRAGKKIEEFPEHLRIREYPRGT